MLSSCTQQPKLAVTKIMRVFTLWTLRPAEDTVLTDQMIGEDEIFLVEEMPMIYLVDGEAVRLELPASVELP